MAETKAWMVVDKNGKPLLDITDSFRIYRKKKDAEFHTNPNWFDDGRKIVRVTITEDTK